MAFRLFCGYSYIEEQRFKRIRDELTEQERIESITAKKEAY